MFWGGTGPVRHGQQRRDRGQPGVARSGWPARYPALLLVAALLLTGCGDANRRGAPAFHTPGAPAATGGTPTTAGSGGPGETGPSATATAGATPTGPTPTRSAARDLRYAFPVRGGNVSYHPTHAAYPGTDIFADCGTPVVAVTDGRILEVSRVDRYSKSGPQGPYNGGRSVSLLADDGVRYYGSHLTAVAAGIEAGVRVRAGQQIGTVGRTGNANNVCHLHFGISPPCAGRDDWWIRRGVVWPAPFLDAWRRKSHRSPAATVTAWHREHGCPKAP